MKKTGKFGIMKSYTTWWSKFMKKFSILYSVFRRKLATGYLYTESKSAKANQTTLHKGTTGYLKSFAAEVHSSLLADNHGPLGWEKLDSRNPKPQLP